MSKSSGDVLIAEPPGESLEACVTVPAKNEEELLPSALRALAEQKTTSGEPLSHDRYEVILLINNTRDRSRQVAEQFQRLYPTFKLHIIERELKKSDSHNGYVRRLLMDEACRRLELCGRLDKLILTTDSDSQVAPNWIARNWEEVCNGAQAVGGRIVIPPCEETLLDPATRVVQRYDHVYRRLVAWIEDRLDPQPHDPWPRHHQHYGASLAVTPRIYRFIGRIPPRRYLEDIAFYQALIRHDVRLRHSNRVRVFTSARLAGRARFGLSNDLRDWERGGNRAMRAPVERREFLEYLFTVRHQLRSVWQIYRETGNIPERRVREFSCATRMSRMWIASEIKSARYFGTLLERTNFYPVCRSAWPDRLRLAPLYRVVENLQSQFREFTESVALERQFDKTQYEPVSYTAIQVGARTDRVHHPLEAGSQVRVRANEP